MREPPLVLSCHWESKAQFTGNGYVEGAASSGWLTPPFTYGLKELRLEVALKDPVQGMSAFVFDAGRMGFSDPSGFILSSPPADGFSFAFKYPGIRGRLPDRVYRSPLPQGYRMLPSPCQWRDGLFPGGQHGQ